jgi:putative oxidoreductase
MRHKHVSILLAVIFLASGGAKLAGLSFEVEAFQRWGYPPWFMYLIGMVEVAGGIGLMVRQLSAAAAAGLSAMMIGAVGTHIVHNEWGMLVLALAIMALAAWRAAVGRNEILGLLRGRRSSLTTLGDE